MDEYKEILQIINNFDDRLLIIKGWAVTFTLATLLIAMQKKTKSIVAVVILSSICFWILEAETKYHQTKYYSRMRAIEIMRADSNGETYKISPLIDWSWEHPDKALEKTEVTPREAPSRPKVYFYRHVMIPHALIILFCLGWFVLNHKSISKSANIATAPDRKERGG